MPTYIWIILGIIASVAALKYWKNRNAVWGGFTLGILIGLVIAFFRWEGEFDWDLVIKTSIIGALVGLGAELLGRLSDRLKRRRDSLEHSDRDTSNQR